MPHRTHAGKVTPPLYARPVLLYPGRVWNQPYLETCCRAALHRVVLAADDARPPGLKDGPCLERLTGMGLCCHRPDGRYGLTEAGRRRHASEILHTEPV